jgi:two-component system nitrate/nitrite response regulator NarL
MQRVSVVIAACEPVLRNLTAALSAEDDFNVVASCRDESSCVEAIRGLSPDLALIDISLQGTRGLRVLAAIKSQHLRTEMVFISSWGFGERQPIAWPRRDVISPKSTQHLLLDFLRQIAPGSGQPPPAQSPKGLLSDPQDSLACLSTPLTERERQIMLLVCKGQSNKEVGRRLGLSEGTVKVHLHHIYQKLAIRNRTSLAASAAHFREQSCFVKGGANGELPLPSAGLGKGPQPPDPLVWKSSAAGNVPKIRNAELPDE